MATTPAHLRIEASFADDRAALLERQADDWEASALRCRGGSSAYLHRLDRAEQLRAEAAAERGNADQLRAQSLALNTTRTNTGKEN